MWAIINLPNKFKNTGELWLKRCKIQERTPSLKDTIEELRSYIQRTEENIKNSKALATQLKENIPSNQRCSNNFHNPQAKNSEEDCWKLHPEKRPKNSKKTVKALLAVNTSANLSSFILDSGATTLMVNHLKYFQDITMKTETIKLADGSVIEALGTRTIRLESKNIILTFKNFLYIPKLATNLISMAAFIKTNHSIHRLNKDQFIVLDHHKQEIVGGTLSSGNFVLDYNHPKAFASTSVPKNIVSLHQAAGHPSIEYFRKMFPNKQIPQFNCLTCNTCKKKKNPFLGKFPQAVQKLEFLHMDLCGPISPPLESGARFIFKIMDGFSHFSWIFFLMNKSETPNILKTTS
ncbi:hypothetical protein O181_120740 [Austropuccinia psidii MF-1]|uniref:Retrovirus-related Pol polyprotein from transposon TNT 1-94-like beta-barrel domain-containing protein n=1 Tax=Austropuccinia psidii MF-1 TaxID=1389203 RepID=A0A9Q3KGB8_9BASI|nr:hypothetical protein [Austropuccinia psidii MF-1]